MMRSIGRFLREHDVCIVSYQFVGGYGVSTRYYVMCCAAPYDLRMLSLRSTLPPCT